MADLVLGVDASTTAVKVIAFDRSGRPHAQARADYPMATPQPGWFEQDSDDWWRALCSAVKIVADAVGRDRIAAISIGHQRETFVLVDADGKALYPAITWLDERARPQVAALSDKLGREHIRDISGKPPDPTPSLYSLIWLREHRPDTIDQARAVLDVQGVLLHHLTGRLATGTASADPLGIVDVRAGQWAGDLVAATGLTAAQLPDLIAPGASAGKLTNSAADACGLLPGTEIIAAGGDGQMAGLGVGAITPDTAYLSLGTGIVSGMYAQQYTTSDAYRTLTSPTGEGFMMETVLRSGMQLVDWMTRLTSGKGTVSGADLDGLEKAARDIDPGSGGLMLMPYWAGVMNPYWDETARGVVLGASLEHRAPHFFRAALEGIAFEQAVATDAMEASIGRKAKRFIVSGGGAKSELLLQIMAAVLERPLALTPVTEAVAAGAGILAAIGAGWFGSAGDAAAAMVPQPERVIEPDPALVEVYRPNVAVYRDIYHATRDIQARLGQLRGVA